MFEIYLTGGCLGVRLFSYQVWLLQLSVMPWAGWDDKLSTGLSRQTMRKRFMWLMMKIWLACRNSALLFPCDWSRCLSIAGNVLVDNTAQGFIIQMTRICQSSMKSMKEQAAMVRDCSEVEPLRRMYWRGLSSRLLKRHWKTNQDSCA